MKIYEGQYEGEPSEWRSRGAASKARNAAWALEGRGVERVLEVGAGDGSVLERLEGLGVGRTFVASDVDPSSGGAVAARGIRGLEAAVTCRGDDLPFGDGAFDACLVMHVLEHVDDPRSVVREAARVAEWVVFEVPVIDALLTRGALPRDGVGHINAWSVLSFQWLVESCGVRVHRVRVSEPGAWVARHGGGPRALLRWLARTLLRVAVGARGASRVVGGFRVTVLGRREERATVP